jgi:hypothetical protein
MPSWATPNYTHLVSSGFSYVDANRIEQNISVLAGGDDNIATSTASATAYALVKRDSAGSASFNDLIAATLELSGASTIGGALELSGDLIIGSSKFTVAALSGNTGIAGALTVSGAISGASLTVSGAITGASLAVSGALSIGTNLTVSGSLGAGATTLYSLSVAHALAVGAELQVGTSISANGGITAGAGLTITGNASISGGITAGTGFGCNGKAAQGAVASYPGAICVGVHDFALDAVVPCFGSDILAIDFVYKVNLINNTLIANGIMS